MLKSLSSLLMTPKDRRHQRTGLLRGYMSSIEAILKSSGVNDNEALSAVLTQEPVASILKSAQDETEYLIKPAFSVDGELSYSFMDLTQDTVTLHGFKKWKTARICVGGVQVDLLLVDTRAGFEPLNKVGVLDVLKRCVELISRVNDDDLQKGHALPFNAKLSFRIPAEGPLELVDNDDTTGNQDIEPEDEELDGDKDKDKKSGPEAGELKITVSSDLQSGNDELSTLHIEQKGSDAEVVEQKTEESASLNAAPLNGTNSEQLTGPVDIPETE